MKKTFKAKGVLALLLLTAVVLAGPAAVPAKEMPGTRRIDRAAASGNHVESCPLCNIGEIYMNLLTRKYEARFRSCQHGVTDGTDSEYNEYLTFIYQCDVCGYGWEEFFGHKVVDCEMTNN